MIKRRYSLAIETSSRSGSVSLGSEDRLIDTLDLVETTNTRTGHVCRSGEKRSPRRFGNLMAAIDRLTSRHQVGPSHLDQIYLSVGPGSFTGLRIAVATAKAMAMVLPVRLVAVPTAHVVAQNVPPQAIAATGTCFLAVCLHHKRDTAYTQLFHHHQGVWQQYDKPTVCSLRSLIKTAPRPLGVVGDTLGKIPSELATDVTPLPQEWVIGRSQAVWRLGRTQAERDHFIDPLKLQPLYARPPEAQELWEQRHRQGAAGAKPPTVRSGARTP